MNREQPSTDPRGGLVCKLASGVEGLVDVTGTVGEVLIEQESGDFTAIGFSFSVAARSRGICCRVICISVIPNHCDS